MEGCVSKHHTLVHAAEWKRLAELQQEAQKELESKAHSKAMKAEAKASADIAQQDTTNVAQHNNNKGRGRGKKPRAPMAPGNKQQSHVVIQQSEEQQKDSPAVSNNTK